MLNYIWLGLIVVGIGVAVATDLHDLSANTYHNGEELAVELQCGNTAAGPTECTVAIDPRSYNRMYGAALTAVVRQRATLNPSGPNSGVLHVIVDDQTPAAWQEIYKAQRNPDFLLAHVRWQARRDGGMTAQLGFDPVKFVKINAVTNDGIVQYAKTAVELAIGLIGIMALWLGVMKVAEQAGLVARLASVLKPLTTRLFPDVPPDHPAMGAMIMNISANILGLANAATPLGLKAMEELNRLNRKLGTATDAMCTFLVINTSNVQLIPATVIAIRAAAGSTTPTEIIGPVILATVVSLTVGITVVKLLAKLPVYRKQLAEAG